jgi:hypothetical protein
MPCCGKSLPEISLRDIFRKVRCISACCGGTIVIQASDIDGRKVPEPNLLQSGKSLKFWWRRFNLPCCKRRRQTSDIAEYNTAMATKSRQIYLHKPVRYRFKRNRVIVGAIDEQWEADLVIMDSLSKYNNGFKYILTVIDS